MEKAEKSCAKLENHNKDLLVRLEQYEQQIAELEQALQEYQLAEANEEQNNSFKDIDSKDARKPEGPGDENGNQSTMSSELGVLQRTRIEVAEHEQELMHLTKYLEELKHDINRVNHEIRTTHDKVRNNTESSDEEINVNQHHGNWNKTAATSKPKHHKQHKKAAKHSHVKQNRLLSLETDVSVLKTKLKRSEEQMEQHKVFLQQKDKELRLAQHKADQLWQRLQAQQSNMGQQGQRDTLLAHTPNYAHNQLGKQGQCFQTHSNQTEITPIFLQLRPERQMAKSSQPNGSHMLAQSCDSGLLRDKTPLITQRTPRTPMLS